LVTTLALDGDLDRAQLAFESESTSETFPNDPLADRLGFSSALTLSLRLSDLVTVQLGPFRFQRSTFPNDPMAAPEVSTSGTLSLELAYESERVEASASFEIDRATASDHPGAVELGLQHNSAFLFVLNEAANISIEVAISVEEAEVTNQLDFAVNAMF